jgi:hypothetical protein
MLELLLKDKLLERQFIFYIIRECISKVVLTKNELVKPVLIDIFKENYFKDEYKNLVLYIGQMLVKTDIVI